MTLISSELKRINNFNQTLNKRKMKRYKLLLTALLATGIFSAVFFGCQKDAKKNPSVTSDAKGGTTAGAYSPVTLMCAGGNTQSTIALTVTAGATGAPAGFTIQWMSIDAYNAFKQANPTLDWPSDASQYCAASFSGVPYGSKNTAQTGGSTYNLGSGQSVIVYIGDLLDDELNSQLGLSTTCSDELQCGTQYVFRAFAHANSTMNRSAYSFYNDVCAKTADCNTACQHHGFGFWKNNPLQVATVIAGLPGGTLSLGTTAYTADMISAILNTAPNGNGYIILAHQLITAKLNQICNDLTAADGDIGATTFSSATNPATPPVTASATTTFKAFAGIISTLHGHNENCVDDCSTAITN
jgi:hypothetical protein